MQIVIPAIVYCLLLVTHLEKMFGTALVRTLIFRQWLAARRGAVMTDQTLQDVDLRNLARVVSACTLGLWSFAAGLLIGVFVFL
jgi:hypothetical protein